VISPSTPLLLQRKCVLHLLIPPIESISNCQVRPSFPFACRPPPHPTTLTPRRNLKITQRRSPPAGNPNIKSENRRLPKTLRSTATSASVDIRCSAIITAVAPQRHICSLGKLEITPKTRQVSVLSRSICHSPIARNGRILLIAEFQLSSLSLSRYGRMTVWRPKVAFHTIFSKCRRIGLTLRGMVGPYGERSCMKWLGLEWKSDGDMVGSFRDRSGTRTIVANESEYPFCFDRNDGMAVEIVTS